eukprot:CAMPEP_0119475430 /NCGR_PEP_ID=MMETSP1344-20130328/6318_1 /TAXON_ID=236787 /ORGANISM="Florenciella parvula, Strain CCMP2471" /LENGTH=1265 /DNA_ID=CAMNT_0007508957 /DNA_START=65 /DNA_END=3862 /DNA_ORIENTATION=-
MVEEKAQKGSLLCWASEVDVETQWRTAKAHTGVAMLNRAPSVVDAETIGTDNSVHSSKYTWWSFLPKGLFEQFRRVANIYFLFISILMTLGWYTDLLPKLMSAFTTLFPLAVILASTLLKEGLEDKKRHEADAETNMRDAQVLQPSDGSSSMPTYKTYSWKDLRVGMVVKIEDRMEIPADVVPLMSSEFGGRCYIETANIDGETNLKLKQCAKTAKDGGVIWESEAELSGVSGLAAEFEPPNPAIHQFKGNLTLEGTGAESNAAFRKVPLNEHQMLLRGAILRNTKWVLGVVIYTGAESKLVLNSREAPSKLSTVEAQVNNMIYFIFCCHALLSLVSTAFHLAWTSAYNGDLWYLCNEGAYEDSDNVLLRENCDHESSSYSIVSYFFNFVVVFNNFIPISLYVTVEFVNLCQAYFISYDKEMYDEVSDTPGLARTSNMNGDLGQIEYIFSDKTGTLTCNEMKFRSSSVGGIIFGHPQGDKVLTQMEQNGSEGAVQMDGNKVRSLDALATLANLPGGDDTSRAARSFAEVMAVCHTVIVENDKKTGDIIYQAESPDEEALVTGAKRVGWMYTDKTPSSVVVRLNGEDLNYNVLALIEFNSTRKRMSVVAQCPDGTYKLLIKGADNIMFDRTATDGFKLCGETNAQGRDTVTRHLDFFSTQGLRTLVLGEKILTQAEAESWTAEWHAACSSTTDRSHLMDLAAAKIEFGVTVVGCTAIEDRLQDDVPQTIADLRVAGVKVWVLTGDKMETAINIGYSCRLLTPDMSKIVIRAEQDPDSTVAPLSIADQLNQAVNSLANQEVDFEPLATSQTWLQRMFGVNKPTHNDFDVGGVEMTTTNFVDSGLKPENLAMVVDGPSLIEILKDDKLRRNLLRVGCCCRAVLACRVSPKQKQMIVKLVKEGLMTKPITLAIGDGANDVGMIQEAQIGVGISGKEGRQAVNNSDFAIAQFRFLKRLMVVHGRWNYRRISATVVYSFYKNIVLTIILFYYQFMCFFSGAVLFEEWVYTAFNAILFLGPLFLGMFDQDLSDEAATKYSKVYSSGRLKKDLNVNVMAWSFIRAYLDATLIYFFCHIAVNGQDWTGTTAWGSNGDTVDMLVFGTTVYTAMIVGMLMKMGILHHTWNKYTISGMVITVVGFPLFLVVYQTSAGNILHGGKYLNVTSQMISAAPFWLLCFLTPAVNSLFDILIEAIRSEFFGDHVDVVRQADHEGNLDTLKPLLAGTPRPDGIDASAAVELSRMGSPSKRPVTSIRVAGDGAGGKVGGQGEGAL